VRIMRIFAGLLNPCLIKQKQSEISRWRDS